MKKNYVDSVREMLKNWNLIFDKLKRDCPTMTEMELHNATRDIINKSISIN